MPIPCSKHKQTFSPTVISEIWNPNQLTRIYEHFYEVFKPYCAGEQKKSFQECIQWTQVWRTNFILITIRSIYCKNVLTLTEFEIWTVIHTWQLQIFCIQWSLNVISVARQKDFWAPLGNSNKYCWLTVKEWVVLYWQTSSVWRSASPAGCFPCIAWKQLFSYWKHQRIPPPYKNAWKCFKIIGVQDCICT